MKGEVIAEQKEEENEKSMEMLPITSYAELVKKIREDKAASENNREEKITTH